jgi:hypothetical protein
VNRETKFSLAVAALLLALTASSVRAHDETGYEFEGRDKGGESEVGRIVEVEPEFLYAAAGGRRVAGDGPTASGAVNGRLKSCLKKLNCRVTSHAGVWRDPKPGNRCSSGRSAWSCHLVGEAIDITGATCSLAKLRDCLEGFRFRACYNGKGGCKSKTKILHFGNHEAVCAPRIYMRHGRCK